MPFQSLKQTNQKLSQNPELSKHNKEVLDDYFTYKKASVGGAHLQDIASRFNVLAPHIDFQLDDPDKKDIQRLIGAINHDEITKQNGEPYSEYSKDSLYKSLSNLYTDYLDYKDWFEDFDNPANIEIKVEPEKVPCPEQIKEIADQARSLRDRCIILFGWAVGARAGELFYTRKTHKFPEGIKWRDIKFKGNEMWVTLRGKTGEREIPVRTSMPLMRKFQQEKMDDLDQHIFRKKNVSNMCPRCSSRLSAKNRSKNYSDREYECKKDGCSWEGQHTEADKEREPLDDESARKVLKGLMREADMSQRLHNNPHKVFRTGRALYWASVGKKEDFLRGFFGWAKQSDAPRHYVALMNESLLSGLREEFGEELSDDEKRFNDGSLKPFNCGNCGDWVSPMWSYCKGCDTEVDEDLRLHNKPEEKEREAEAAMETLTDLAAETGIPEEDFRELAHKRMQQKKQQLKDLGNYGQYTSES